MCVFFSLLQGEITITYNRIEPPKGRGMDIGKHELSVCELSPLQINICQYVGPSRESALKCHYIYSRYIFPPPPSCVNIN